MITTIPLENAGTVATSELFIVVAATVSFITVVIAVIHMVAL